MSNKDKSGKELPIWGVQGQREEKWRELSKKRDEIVRDRGYSGHAYQRFIDIKLGKLSFIDGEISIGNLMSELENIRNNYSSEEYIDVYIKNDDSSGEIDGLEVFGRRVETEEEERIRVEYERLNCMKRGIQIVGEKE